LPQPELPPQPQFKHPTQARAGNEAGSPAPGTVRSSRPAPGRKSILGEHGHARAAFRRAIERGKIVVAEIEALEVGQLDLGEALELTAFVALRDRERGRRFAVRWLVVVELADQT
jgi:hypothetical protein